MCVGSDDALHVVHECCGCRVVEDECGRHVHACLLTDAGTELHGTQGIDASVHQRLIETNVLTHNVTESRFHDISDLRCKHERGGRSRNQRVMLDIICGMHTSIGGVRLVRLEGCICRIAIIAEGLQIPAPVEAIGDHTRRASCIGSSTDTETSKNVIEKCDTLNIRQRYHTQTLQTGCNGRCRGHTCLSPWTP